MRRLTDLQLASAAEISIATAARFRRGLPLKPISLVRILRALERLGIDPRQLAMAARPPKLA